MGYGANMTVKNDYPGPIQLLISDVTCMYDNGEDNSQLSSFNDVTVAQGQSLGPIYIEAKNSGSCFGAPSSFTLKVVDIGDITIEDDSENYYSPTNSDPDAISADIDNNGNPAKITVTVIAG